jgi:hypothetical protein
MASRLPSRIFPDISMSPIVAGPFILLSATRRIAARTLTAPEMLFPLTVIPDRMALLVELYVRDNILIAARDPAGNVPVIVLPLTSTSVPAVTGFERERAAISIPTPASPGSSKIFAGADMQLSLTFEFMTFVSSIPAYLQPAILLYWIVQPDCTTMVSALLFSLPTRIPL